MPRLGVVPTEAGVVVAEPVAPVVTAAPILGLTGLRLEGKRVRAEPEIASANVAAPPAPGRPARPAAGRALARGPAASLPVPRAGARPAPAGGGDSVSVAMPQLEKRVTLHLLRSHLELEPKC